jgi:hypothetical protein
MFDIAGNGIITVTRGDTFTTTLFVNTGTALVPVRYTLTGDDRVYFAVCEPNQAFEDAVVKKEFSSADLDDDGDVVIKFTSNDTEYLLPGDYYYEVKLYKVFTDTTKNEIDTIVPRTKFVIME